MNLPNPVTTPAFNTSGKLIRFAPIVEPQVAILQKAARQGFYYPALALKQLKSLASGPNGKHNVFIPNLNDHRAHTHQMFCIFLPGIKATIERRPNDTYVVTRLDLSDGYAQIGKGDNKPGIYSVTNIGDQQIHVTYRNNSRITPENNRVVVICDGGYENPLIAAKDVSNGLKDLAGELAAVSGEFDIVYSGTSTTPEGMKSYNSFSNTAFFATSSILANAMIKAKNKKGVFWASQFNGSSIFTQAMYIVANQNISLDTHGAKMFKPTTNTTEAIKLAHKIGFRIGSDFATTNGFKNSITMLHTNALRAKNAKDPYNWKNYMEDISKQGLGGVALASAGLFALTLPSTTGLLGVASAAASGIGAAQLLWTRYKYFSDKPKTK